MEILLIHAARATAETHRTGKWMHALDVKLAANTRHQDVDAHVTDKVHGGQGYYRALVR